jgi:hypothetical protein
LDTPTHFEFVFVCVRGRKFHKARSEKRQQEFCTVRGILYRSRGGSLAAASPSTPPRPAVASPSPPEPSPPDPVRRLSLGGYTSTVDESGSVPASRSPSPAVKIVSAIRITCWARTALHLSKEKVSSIVYGVLCLRLALSFLLTHAVCQALSPPPDESDSVAASRPPSPAVVCSQYRLQQQVEEGILDPRYPTPPAAPLKDCYISEPEMSRDQTRRAKVRARCGRRWPRSSATENSKFTRCTTALYRSPTSILGCLKAGETTILRSTPKRICAGRAAWILL